MQNRRLLMASLPEGAEWRKRWWRAGMECWCPPTRCWSPWCGTQCAAGRCTRTRTARTHTRGTGLQLRAGQRGGRGGGAGGGAAARRRVHAGAAAVEGVAGAEPAQEADRDGRGRAASKVTCICSAPRHCRRRRCRGTRRPTQPTPSRSGHLENNRFIHLVDMVGGID